MVTKKPMLWLPLFNLLSTIMPEPCSCIYIYIYVSTYIYIYIYMHGCMCICRHFPWVAISTAISTRRIWTGNPTLRKPSAKTHLYTYGFVQTLLHEVRMPRWCYAVVVCTAYELCSLTLRHLGGGHKPDIYAYECIYIYIFICTWLSRAAKN